MKKTKIMENGEMKILSVSDDTNVCVNISTMNFSLIITQTNTRENDIRDLGP